MKKRSPRKKAILYAGNRVFYDQGVLGNVIDRGAESVAFVEQFKRDAEARKLDLRLLSASYVSFFSILELLGVGRGILERSEEVKGVALERIRLSKDNKNIKGLVRSAYYEHFSTDPELDLEYLKSIARSMIVGSASQIGKTTLDAIINILEVETTHTFATALAIDRTFAFEFPRSIWQAVQASFLEDVIDFLSRDIHCSPTRGIHKLTQNFLFRKALNSPEGKQKFSHLAPIVMHSKYKSSKDLVDTDLVHFACVGRTFGGHKPSPMLCFTCDPYETIVERVNVYRGGLRRIMQIHNERITNGTAHGTLKVSPGTIAFLSKRGEILKIRHVKDMKTA